MSKPAENSSTPSVVAVHPDGTLSPRGYPAEIHIKPALDEFNGREVAVVKGADWLADYYDCVPETPHGRPLILLDDLEWIPRQLARDHRVTVDCALITHL